MAGETIRRSKEDWFRDGNTYPEQCFIGRDDSEPGRLEILSIAEVQAMLGVGSSNHNDLPGLQGGTPGEYYHLTAAEHLVVQNTSGTNTGDQDLSSYALTSALGDYVKRDGTTALTANWDVGSFALRALSLILDDTSAQLQLHTGNNAAIIQSGSSTSAKTHTLPNATGTLATLANITQTFAGAVQFGRTIVAQSTTAAMNMLSSGGGDGNLIMPSTVSSFNYTMPSGSTTLTGNSIANTFSQNQTISKATPKLIFTDSGGDDYEIGVTAGVFAIRNTTDGRDDLSIGAGGELTLGASGTNLGFYGTTPVARSTGWTTSNVTTDKVLDANSTTLDEVADVLCTLIETLKTNGLLGA